MNKYTKQIQTLCFIIFIIALSIPSFFAPLSLPAAETQKEPPVDLTELRKLAILEHGRVKPLDTFAMNLVKQFYGRDHFDGDPAIQWLARALFQPELSRNDRVFLITNPDVLDSIGVQREGKARERYSFNQLEKGLMQLRQLAMKANGIDPQARGIVDNEILGLYNKVFIYQQLLGTFDVLHPHSDFTITQPDTAAALELPADQVGKPLSFFQLMEKRLQMETLMKSETGKTGADESEAQKEITKLYQNLNAWARYYGDLPLTIVPPLKGNEKALKDQIWGGPWVQAPELLLDASQPLPPKWHAVKNIVFAYRNGDQKAFDQNIALFHQEIMKAAGINIHEKALAQEVFYNKVDAFHKAKFFYGFAALCILLSFVAWKKWFYRFGFVLLATGFCLQLWGTVARMIIMERPPVTNLYETFLFTGLTTALLGIILELFKKKNIGILTGALAGLAMLMIAGKYALEGDTMGMLVAVLDSNFWLAFHVITIMLGYAGIVLSGFIGHGYILQNILYSKKPEKKKLLDDTFQALYSIQAFGIVFTFLGTVLGGIWADQSWGRFWGWDPKENGALVILLWSAILFHGRKAGWIKELGMAYGSVIGVIAVALAWFGVNLLGVGLHSYGFTSGVAFSLFTFIGAECLFIIVTSLLVDVDKKMRKTS